MKGPIAKLLKLKDETAATALEVTAGGKVHVQYMPGLPQSQKSGQRLCTWSLVRYS